MNLAIRIKCNDYWKRRVDKTWPVVDVSRCAGNYKRFFFEKYLEDEIEQFVPKQSNMDELLRLARLLKDEIERLKLTQLLPPIPEVETVPDEDDDDELFHDHLDLGPITNE